ncbi:MAG: DUF3891 family protein [Acidobacteriales bacterium]|nr:DUF3891 family protein [Terriglobales bacterium]
MIVRPLEVPLAPEPSRKAAEPVWAAIERSQSQKLESCWLITQPTHAALAAEMAAKLDDEQFPDIDANVVRAIALHDAGWSAADARAIQTSRAVDGNKKISRVRTFLEYQATEVIEIWTSSIETAAKLSPLGGALVSRHFASIAGHYSADPKPAEPTRMFMKREAERQEALLKRSLASAQKVQRLVEALQFCDLLSLYLCCGLAGNVQFPQTIHNRPIELASEGDGETCRLSPNPFKNEQVFTVAGIRHPKLGRGGANSLVFFLRVK